MAIQLFVFSTNLHQPWMRSLKACPHWIRIQTGSVNRVAQCESNVHWSHPHCIVRNQIHACTLTSSGHTSTQLPWCHHQICTSASHHIASWVEQIRGTQCVAWRSMLTVSSRHECACHAIFGPYTQLAIVWSSSIQIETTSGSGLGLIQFGSGLGECAFSVVALKPDSIFNAHWVSSVDRP